MHCANSGVVLLKATKGPIETSSRELWRLRAVPLLLACVALACGQATPIDYSGPTAEWPEFSGTSKGQGIHYSPLHQINRENIGQLELAWEHRTGDSFPGSAELAPTAHQVTPLVVNDTLYYCTPYMRVFALDPETGEERWVFDPELRAREIGGPYPLTCRGLAYWAADTPEEGQDDPSGDPCQKRLLFGTKDSELLALDADTGLLCEDFGEAGRVALREGLEGDLPAWEYYPTSPPLVMGDIAVLGALVADQLRTDAPSGVVRAFDVRTGQLRWAWDPVPPGWKKKPLGEEEYARGTPNVWSLLSGDEERGLVFVPTGNASPDSYGGEREGLDYYSSSVVALDAKTGEVKWRFQTVHHDVWDYDVAPQPALFQHPEIGDGAPGLLQATKMGLVFLLNRETGEPMYPVEERPVPQGGVEGESLSPTQPFPTHPAPLNSFELEPWGFTPVDRAGCEKLFARYRYEGIYTPPTLAGSIQYPHTAGGVNWAGVALDPNSGIMITNQTHVAMMTQLVPRDEFDKLDLRSIYYPNEAYPMAGTAYGVRRSPLFSLFGAPCNAPPWGSLMAVDLKSGEVLWRVPLGTTRDVAPFPLWLELGMPSFGGGLVTAGGLYFTGATMDRYFRAFDTETGEEVWSVRIPFSGNAAPMSYRLRQNAKQYVVIAAGGNPLTGPGDALLAFALKGGRP